VRTLDANIDRIAIEKVIEFVAQLISDFIDYHIKPDQLIDLSRVWEFLNSSKSEPIEILISHSRVQPGIYNRSISLSDEEVSFSYEIMDKNKELTEIGTIFPNGLDVSMEQLDISKRKMAEFIKEFLSALKSHPIGLVISIKEVT